MVASPPSSTIRSGPSPPQFRQESVRSQYSSQVSPFHAKTSADFASTRAAAAWSWVEKILQEHHLSFAPRAPRVSTRQAVWMVTCRDPEILAPLRGWSGPYYLRIAMSPGISTSARSSSFLPQLAREMSFILDMLKVIEYQYSSCKGFNNLNRLIYKFLIDRVVQNFNLSPTLTGMDNYLWTRVSG